MTSTYSISFTYTEGGGGTFNGRFTVDGSGIILSFYDIRDLGTNILISNCSAINTYIVSPFNFQANILNAIAQGNPYLNLSSDNIGSSYKNFDVDCISNYPISTQFIITPYVPPNRFSLKQICCSIYSDNARVFYKPHSLPSCGVGTVKNSRHTARKT